MRLVLKPFVRWSRPHDGIGVFEGGGLSVFIRGVDTVEAVSAFVTQLDGRALDLVASASGLDDEDAQALAQLLIARRLADDLDADSDVTATGHLDPDLVRALSAYTNTPRAAAARLTAAEVAVSGPSDVVARATAMLAEVGVRTVVTEVTPATAAALYVELAPTGSGPATAQRAARGVPFVPVVIDASVARIGPTVVSNHACWTCAQVRFQNQSIVPGLVASRAAATAASAAALPSLVAAALGLALQEVVLLASRARSGRWLDRVAVIGGEHADHPILKVVGCPECVAPSSGPA